jgi:hypothetical protein
MVAMRRIFRSTLVEVCPTTLIAVLLSGCATTETMVVSALRPQLRVGLARFEIGKDHVEVFAKTPPYDLFNAHEKAMAQLAVRPGDAFRARGFNRTERWTLTRIAEGHACFDVHGKFYGCTGPFATYVAIPSHSYRSLVIVCPHSNALQRPGE